MIKGQYTLKDFTDSLPTYSVQVLLCMGSNRDWSKGMNKAADILDELGMSHIDRVISAHRTPERILVATKWMKEYDVPVAICGAGLAAHLAGGMAAHLFDVLVVGVPLDAGTLGGQEAVGSTLHMPPGVPVATVGIGRGDNAALLAAMYVGRGDLSVRQQVLAWRKRQNLSVPVYPVQPDEDTVIGGPA
jgi:5-(carboxyamino)imidazole ribonucleotide mutase